MHNLSITGYNTSAKYNQPFGSVKLGRGGDIALSKKLFMKNAKEFITSQSNIHTTVLVTENTVEVIPPEVNFILKVTGRYKKTPNKNFVYIEVEDHGKKGYVKIPRNIKNSDIFVYGKENSDFSLARILAKEIDNNARWESGLFFQKKGAKTDTKATLGTQQIKTDKEAQKNLDAIRKLVRYA